MAASDYVPTFFKKPLALGGASTDEYTPLNSHRVVSIDTRVKAEQTAACPNPSREAKRRGNRKRQKGLHVVFHVVLQYT